jgi:AmiR/NasT family two-component response regulator
MLSADASPGRIQHFLDSGAHAYLTKPLDVRKFLSVLDEISARRDSGGAIG